jgi:hypothetical protein
MRALTILPYGGNASLAAMRAAMRAGVHLQGLGLVQCCSTAKHTVYLLSWGCSHCSLRLLLTTGGCCHSYSSCQLGQPDSFRSRCKQVAPRMQTVHAITWQAESK